MKRQLLSMTVNNEPFEMAVPGTAALLEVLRDELGLMAVKEGCPEGVCGASTVLMDGQPVRSCITLAQEADGSSITTIEGLAPRGAYSSAIIIETVDPAGPYGAKKAGYGNDTSQVGTIVE